MKGSVHMTMMDKETLKTLVEAEEIPAISIYHCRPDRKDSPTKSQIQFKNAFARVETLARDAGLKPSVVKQLLESAKRLVTLEFLWEHHAQGMALFLSPTTLVMSQVPFEVEDAVHVSDRFYIKPLIKLFSEDGHLYILALSRKNARILDCTRISCRLILSEEFPDDRWTREHSLQFSTGTPSRFSSQMRSALYHGHSKATDNYDVLERELLKRVDQRVGNLIPNKSSPLVIAAVTRLAGVYRQVSQYPNLAAETIEGNPDNLSLDQLFRRAWSITEERFQKSKEKALDRYRELSGTEWSSDNTEDIVRAACNARIDKLFIPSDRKIWGQYDGQEERVSICDDRSATGTRELLNFAAVASLKQGAEVFLVSGEKMPTDQPMAALFRYPRRELRGVPLS